MKRQIISYMILVLLLSGFGSSHKDLNEYGKWLEFHRLKDEDFNKTKPGVEKKIKWIKYELTDDFRKLVEPFFIYSADSAYFIDLDSYSLHLERDTNGQLLSRGSAVDTKIQLVKRSESKAAVLLNCDTLCYAETALWRNKSWLELAGFKINEAGKFVPTIWKVDLLNMLFTEYSATKTFAKRPKSYATLVRLKKVKQVNKGGSK